MKKIKFSQNSIMRLAPNTRKDFDCQNCKSDYYLNFLSVHLFKFSYDNLNVQYLHFDKVKKSATEFCKTSHA